MAICSAGHMPCTKWNFNVRGTIQSLPQGACPTGIEIVDTAAFYFLSTRATILHQCKQLHKCSRQASCSWLSKLTLQDLDQGDDLVFFLHLKLQNWHTLQMVEDVSNAVSWLHKTCESFGGSAKDLSLVGHSAGAQLCLMSLLHLLKSSKKSAEAQRFIPQKCIGRALHAGLAQSVHNVAMST